MVGVEGTISRTDLAERLRHFNMATYLSTSDLLSAGVVALAAGVALEIIGGRDLDRLAFWVASLMLFVAFHALWRLGALFASWSSGIVDYIAPLALGLFEFAQFIVLSAQFRTGDYAGPWLWMTVGQVAMAAVFIHNRLVHTRQAGQYTEDCDAFISAYADFMQQGRLYASIWALGLVACSAAALVWPQTRPLALFGGAGLSAALALVSLRVSVKFQKSFQDLLFTPDRRESAAASV